MKYLLGVILSLFLITNSYSEEAFLTIKCDKDERIVVNNYLQVLDGTERRYMFNIPANQYINVEVFSYKDGSPTVTNIKRFQLNAGGSESFDFRDKSKIETKPKASAKKPNFGVFGKTEKTELKKPDFGCIIGVTERPPIKTTVASIPLQQIQYDANCVTGY